MADQNDIDELLLDAEERMEKSIEVFKHETEGMRTGRANPDMLDSLRVEYYGTEMPLKQLATVSAPEPRLLTVQPFDRGAVKAIEKELLRSDLGLTPNVDGNIIRLPIPVMTHERRQDMIKRLKRQREDTHVAIRNVRRDCLEQLRAKEKAKDISEDDLRRYQERLQKITDEHVAQADQVSARKEADLMEV
ncbi:MAG: ribosome recycling factor [Dehalococcoidia bacterium]